MPGVLLKGILLAGNFLVKEKFAVEASGFMRHIYFFVIPP
jgi:hypothetical protein